MSESSGDVGAVPQGRMSPLARLLRSLGPALIVACVVLGPGSILTASQVGCQYGYDLLWTLAAAGTLMAGAVAAAARVGVGLDASPCAELAQRVGRPAALLAGLCVFGIASCFQFSNNLGVLASIEPLAPLSGGAKAAVLAALNLLLIACLFGFKRLYAPLEKLMMVMVAMMLAGFAANLWFAQPSPSAALAGLVPGFPPELSGSLVPRIETAADGARRLVDPWFVVQGLAVTTFSIAGAFYQAYLVREKGWNAGQLRAGLVDVFAGMLVLVGITMLIMCTSAAVLHGRVEPQSLRSAADVARQLEPLFGASAKWLFCLGIFAGAFSSFLVNSMIGGALLADGLGCDARIDSRATKWGTTAVLLIGMTVALATDEASRVPLIIFAQGMTVLGGPVLAWALWTLLEAVRREGRLAVPGWIRGLTLAGGLVVLALAVRTAWRVALSLQL